MTQQYSIEEEIVFKYLVKLRDSGKTNMFGATPYIQKMFGFNEKKASDLLLKWIESFDEVKE